MKIFGICAATLLAMLSLHFWDDVTEYKLAKLPVIIEEEEKQIVTDKPIYSISYIKLPQQNQEDLILEQYIDIMIRISKGRLTKDEAISILTSAKKVSNLSKIPLSIILGMIAQESNFISKANSFLGASYGRGLMQVSEIGLKDFNNKTGNNFTISDLYNPETNLLVGCWIYLNNINYGVDNIHSHLIIAYNCGHRIYKNEKNYLLNAKRKNGTNYNHLNKVLTYIEEFSNVPN